MRYALVQNDTIQQVGLPETWYDEDNARWWDFRTGAPDPSTGWLPVAEVPRPADTDAHTFTSSIQLVGGEPTVVWEQRAWTAEELAAIVTAANEATLRADPQVQIDDLRASITALQAADDALQVVRNKTNAEINNTIPQTIKDVTQQAQQIARESRKVARAAIRLARLQLGVLDSASTE